MTQPELILGTDDPGWLQYAGPTLIVSFRRLAGRKRWPVAACDWVGDSGGFTELTLFGGWRTSPAEHVARVRRARAEVGRMRWAAIQDHMCEPWLLAKTGLTVARHQELTIDSALELRELAPEVSWLPVVQGWQRDDYLRHVEAYARRGIFLEREPVVGVGSVCRRQHMDEAVEIFRALRLEAGLRLHAFGLKASGLPRVWPYIVSSDSMAWSYRARREGTPLMPGCTHRNCSHCRKWAVHWHERLTSRVSRYAAQGVLFPEEAA